MRDKLTRFLWALARLAERTAIAGAASWWVRWWAVPAAYAERGYEAVGGEWVLIAFTFIFVFWLMGIFLRKEDAYYAVKVSALSQDFENPGSYRSRIWPRLLSQNVPPEDAGAGTRGADKRGGDKGDKG